MTSWAFAAPFRLSLAGTVGLAADFEAVAGSGSLTVGAQIATLSVTSESGSGARPYAATVLPLRGEVPSGSHISNAAGTEVGDILSAYDDGSAAVAVFASTASATGSVPLHVATGTAPAALTAAAVTAQVTSVAVAFGSPYGTASITDFSTPERVWWATSKVYCARYRVAAPTPGSTALEAVIDIQAWADRALVEVVVENGKFDAAASTTSTKPAAATYTAAVASINGSTVATVNSADCAEGSHGAFRAWHASGWVGAGDAGLRVTQLHSELQAHPLLQAFNEASTYSMATYASDAYAPWGTGRHRATNMGGTGDHASIGPIPEWEAHALQSGDYRAWRATEASALAMLSYNVNHRDSVTGRVPDSSIMPTKCQGSFWANWPRNTAEPAFEVAHQPAAGLMAFIARPSPVFIEIAQKIAVWTGTVDSTRDILGYFDEAAAGITDCTGIIGNTQIRSKAWGPRNIAHATFITPDAHPWRAGGLEWLDRNTRFLNAYRVNTRGTLLPLYEGFPDASTDLEASMSGVQMSLWMYHFCVVEWAKIAGSRLLAGISGARQTAVDTVADRLCDATVKWVTEQENGGWRFLPYRSRIGDTSGSMSAYSTWTAQRAADLSGAPSATTGLFNGSSAGDETTWSAVEARGTETVALEDSTYCANFVAALGAAVDRGVANATTAWATVTAGITNWTTWRGTFASSPKWGAYPRTNVEGWGTGSDTGTLVGDVWTPARDGAGLVNAASWAIVPAGRLIEIAGTRMDGLDAVVKAAPGYSGWFDRGNSDWIGVLNAWNGMATDTRLGLERLFTAASGGHNDSANDGVYQFSIRKMAWSVLRLPMLPSNWSASYNPSASATFTGYDPAAAYYGSNPSNAEGVYSDEFFDPAFPSDPVKSPRTPTSRHTYGSLAFAPTLGAAGKILMGCRRYWEFDIATGQWALPKFPFDATPTSGATGQAGENMNGWWNQTEGRYYLSASQNNNGSTTWSVLAGGTGWRWEPGYPGGYPSSFMACDENESSVRFLLYQGESTVAAGKPLTIYNYNLTTHSASTHAVTLGASLSGKTFLNFWDGQGMCYVPTLNKYLCNVAYTESGQQTPFAWIDGASYVAELANLPGIALMPSSLLERKIKFMPALNAVVILNSADRGLFIYKVA